MRDPEYDRFGPWILEITQADPIPPVFIPYSKRNEEPLLAMKIPRDEERRNLSPGDHMYDYLVSLYEKEIEILSRNGDEAVRVTIQYRDIAALQHTQNLLDGHLVIFAPGITYDLPYNTVSANLIVRMAAIIRKRYTCAEPVSIEQLTEVGDVAERYHLSFFFEGILKKREASEINGRIFAIQEETRMRELHKHILPRLFYRAVDKRLLETVHFINSRELEVISRAGTWAYRWQPVYGKSTLYVPLDRLAKVAENDCRGASGISEMTLATDSSSHRFLFTQENPAIERYRSIAPGGSARKR